MIRLSYYSDDGSLEVAEHNAEVVRIYAGNYTNPRRWTYRTNL